MKHILCSFIVVFSSVIFAGTIDPQNADSKYLEYGAKHTCVLKIVGHMDGDANTPYSASCIVIDPYYVVTAAHVVFNAITHTVIYDSKPYPCAVVAIHSEFDPKTFGKNDIAIIRLHKPITLDFYPELYKNRDEKDKICSIAGFGFTGSMSTGYSIKNFDYKKRAGSNIVSSIDNNLLICSSIDRKTSLEFLIAPGDSGGGLFINNKLAGINSCVFGNDGESNSDYGDTSGHTRVSDYVDWIEKCRLTLEHLSKPKLGD